MCLRTHQLLRLLKIALLSDAIIGWRLVLEFLSVFIIIVCLLSSVQQQQQLCINIETRTEAEAHKASTKCFLIVCYVDQSWSELNTSEQKKKWIKIKQKFTAGPTISLIHQLYVMVWQKLGLTWTKKVSLRHWHFRPKQLRSLYFTLN